MMPLPYRWLTSLLVRYNGSSLLIDCGEGTQIAIKKRLEFQTHRCDLLHTLPRRPYQRTAGPAPDYGNADRTEPLTLIGPKGLERVVNSLRVIAPELPISDKIYRNHTAGADI